MTVAAAASILSKSPMSSVLLQAQKLGRRQVAGRLLRPVVLETKNAASFFSTMPPKSEQDGDSEDLDADGHSHPTRQPFVTAKLEPGEWDMDRTDPYFRPKPPQRSRMISAEDFANRPPVGFDNEFSTYHDSMIALSWLDTKTCRHIYQRYVDMMIHASSDTTGSGKGDAAGAGSNNKNSSGNSRTSHEYVIRVLAERYRITPLRAAGVVQLQHNEEQMRWHRPELLCDSQAHNAEEMILQNISDAYRAERTDQPGTVRAGGGAGGRGPVTVLQPFVEDPAGIHGRGEPDEISRTFVSTDDIYDMDMKLEEANQRDAERARILLDEHVYREDVDESVVTVPTDGAAKRLLKAHNQHGQKKGEKQQKTEIPYPETNIEGEKRPRWKYVAQVVNTRAQRKKGRKLTSYVNNRMDNTLVEEDGSLRVATVAEAKQVAWKPTVSERVKGGKRNKVVPKQMEAIYEGAKKAWLERELQGKTDVWGKAPDEPTPPAKPAATEAGSATIEGDNETKPDEEGDDGTVDDLSSSDSDSDSSDTESDSDSDSDTDSLPSVESETKKDEPSDSDADSSPSDESEAKKDEP
eukprot:CAMPEP_0113458718 /NCGR_PEP_ID=MMETSP0014_2-20120614/10068_1 /TAXON_ID=2857 /ORGANISM="Nitzschia sp." /LENGTH=578 /DNA_ID=CAMNT_0000350253 /DNA_START=21 /DNA_END=1757 /DNA_ORIENTATION=+ /assembly_acc=CAM_ASM_000159